MRLRFYGIQTTRHLEYLPCSTRNLPILVSRQLQFFRFHSRQLSRWRLSLYSTRSVLLVPRNAGIGIGRRKARSGRRIVGRVAGSWSGNLDRINNSDHRGTGILSIIRRTIIQVSFSIWTVSRLWHLFYLDLSSLDILRRMIPKIVGSFGLNASKMFENNMDIKRP